MRRCVKRVFIIKILSRVCLRPIRILKRKLTQKLTNQIRSKQTRPLKMASVENKRPHVMTKRMQEYLRMKHPQEGGEAADDTGGGHKLLHCPHSGCDKVLTSTPGLRYHIRTHDATGGGAYSCSRCKKHFRSYNGLRYHTQRTKCESSGSDCDTESEETSSNCASPSKTSAKEHMMDFEGYGETQEQTTAKRSLSDSEAEYLPAVETSGGGDFDDQHNWLRELAIIATGPQSPLLQAPQSPSTEHCQRSYHPLEDTMHSYARPPPRSRSPSPPPKLIRPTFTPHPRKQRHKSEPSSRDAFSCLTDLPDPTPLWLIFLQGCRLCIDRGDPSAQIWYSVEDFRQHINTLDPSYGEEGLQLVSMGKMAPLSMYEWSSLEQVKMRFSPDSPSHPDIWACCPSEHPFFVKDKGWSSMHPDLTKLSYGVTCAQLEVNDLCLPPSHPLTTLSREVLDSLKSYDLSAMDSSAVLMLSNMEKQKKEQESLSPPVSPSRCSPSKQEPKAKRPMNAFMLFAKKFRMEYMHQHPGKDNRAISVLLGDTWKKMGLEERRAYTQEAKQLADQQKKLHPDCWKRKRSVSMGALER